jgi:HK97 family phage major capsid protein
MVTTAIPTTQAELEELLHEPERVKDIWSDPDKLTAFLRSYAGNIYNRDTELLAQLKDQTQSMLADWLRDNPNSDVTRLNLNPTTGPNNRWAPLHNKRAIGAPLDGVFEDLSDYLGTIWHNSHRTSEQTRKFEQLRNYQEKVPSEGGFLVPEEFRAEILRLSLESSIVRPRARVIPMGSQTLRFPAIDDTSHASSVFGGIVVYRTEEGADLTESTASFGSIKLDASKQTALAHITNELLRDAAGGAGIFFQEIVPEAFAWFEDVDFLTGNGAGVPLGALSVAGNTALVAVAAETGQLATTIVWENVLRMYARMLPSSLDRAVWIASPDTFFELATMALSVGTGGSAVWLVDGTGAPRLTLLGRPVIMSEKAPAALGTQGDLSFVDFGMYLIGDRQNMTIESSPHVKFTSDKTTFRCIARNDGRPWLQSPITPHNSSATLSPFIQLATR